jgi:lipopolysaccharide export system protein LptC
MAIARDTHSRVVALAKIALPLLALAILSTLFLFARTIDPNDAIPYAEVDVVERAREPRLTAPTYAGVTSDGAALTLQAAEARPDAGAGATAQTLTARLDTPDGARTDLAAAQMTFDNTAGLVSLDGGVTVTTTSGYIMTTNTLTARLDRTSLLAPGPVQATAPAGTITAQGMTLTQGPDPATYVLVFKGRVKLLYQPQN